MKHVPALTLFCISCLLTASAQTPPASSQPTDKTTKHEQAGTADSTTTPDKTATPPSGASGTGNTATTDTGKGDAAKSTPPAPTWVLIVAYVVIIVSLVIFIAEVVVNLKKTWSLADALSESVGGKPSISRLIAFLGFGVIICIYVGIGLGIVYQLLSGGPLSDLKGLGTFMAGAAALFAPYLANQIKGAVTGGNTGPTTTPPGSGASVASVSPNAIPSGSPQK